MSSCKALEQLKLTLRSPLRVPGRTACVPGVGAAAQPGLRGAAAGGGLRTGAAARDQPLATLPKGSLGATPLPGALCRAAASSMDLESTKIPLKIPKPALRNGFGGRGFSSPAACWHVQVPHPARISFLLYLLFNCHLMERGQCWLRSCYPKVSPRSCASRGSMAVIATAKPSDVKTVQVKTSFQTPGFYELEPPAPGALCWAVEGEEPALRVAELKSSPLRAVTADVSTGEARTCVGSSS